MFINMFEESCGILGKEKKTPIVVNDTRSICSQKRKKNKFFFLIYLKNNDHMVDVSMIIVL